MLQLGITMHSVRREDGHRTALYEPDNAVITQVFEKTKFAYLLKIVSL